MGDATITNLPGRAECCSPVKMGTSPFSITPSIHLRPLVAPFISPAPALLGYTELAAWKGVGQVPHNQPVPILYF